MGALQDLTVVEFGQYIAVPLCGQLLSDAGARVIKVEPPEGASARSNEVLAPGFSRMFVNKNRGKYCVTLNLRTDGGLAIARNLAAKADVVLANFRPGLAGSLGLDYESLREANSGVIYASNSGFGKVGAEAAQPAFDGLLQAFSGLNVRPPSFSVDPPPDLAPTFADFTAALTLTYAVLAALHHRDRTGEGQEVSTSLLGATIFLQANRIMHVGLADGWHEEFLRELPSWNAEGRTWPEIGREYQAKASTPMNYAYVGTYRAKDGTIVISAGGRPLQRKLVELFGVMDPWVETRTFSSAEAARTETERVTPEIAAKIAEHPVGYWRETFGREGIPVADQHHYLEMLQHPQVHANGYLYEFENENLGKSVVVGPTARLEGTPLRPAFPLRSPGEDTALILGELGYGPEEIDDLARQGAVGLSGRTGGAEAR